MAFVKVGDTVISKDLIRQGLARLFTRYCNRPICQEWQLLEAEAREKKRGLWSMPNGIPPWEFRRGGRWRQSLRLSSPNLPMTCQ